MMTATRRLTFPALLAAFVIGLAGLFADTRGYASEIKYIVNDVPITSYDIARRAAFLKLQRRSGSASDAMIEQALQVSEINRRRIKIADQQVDDAYARFAAGNKLSVAQVDQIMAQSGVTKAHFKDYIRAQMGWSQVLGAKVRSEARISEQDAVQRMLQQGGTKPTATEYLLQQVIFVVPASERSAQLGKRKREAEAMRARFNGCDTTREFAKGLLDVTVRDLGKVLAPELPPDWAESIKSTKTGQATAVRETDRGVEFIGICSAREVSDDRVAQMVFQSEIAGEEKPSKLSEEYLAELRKNARIIQR
ncbi:peptidylprolyl isomerase [Aquibium sp. LZ166]|uniref:Peptidylprolyl isomerase n=1 Tax=Aquibium pacificus TaxID=3153579 RepID=A0ABV3SQ46_9HYPH